MTLDTAMLTAHLVLCAAIFWSCFCRQARSTRHTTRPQIRGAFWMLSVAAVALGIAPWAPALWVWAPAYSVTWPVLLMLLAVATVQMTTAHYWRRGVPASFSVPADSVQAGSRNGFTTCDNKHSENEKCGALRRCNQKI